MDKNDLKQILDFLVESKKRYNVAFDRSSKRRIEDSVFHYGKRLNDDIYLLLSEERGTGLFKPAFFQSDLDNSISIIKKLLEED